MRCIVPRHDEIASAERTLATQTMHDLTKVEIEEPSDDVPYEASGARRVLIQPYDYAVRTLMDMVIEGDLILDPDYQRQYRWNDVKASRFVESVALNIPVPVMYLAEDADGSFSVIDGQQRLTSLMRFIKPDELRALFPELESPELALTGLKVRSDMNGKRFNDLDRADRSAIAKRPIRCIVVLNESDSTLKFEVFERLNTGSTSLTDQEVRNCIYRGSYNNLLKVLAKNKKFQELISLSEVLRNTMKDVELVLRFFAYGALTEQTDYSGNYAEYLNSHMEENREVSPPRRQELEQVFSTTVDLIYETLGPGAAFRKPINRTDARPTYAQNLINGAIYESQMIAFARLVASGAAVDPEHLRQKVTDAFRDDDYWNSLFQATSQKAKVLMRKERLTRHLMA